MSDIITEQPGNNWHTSELDSSSNISIIEDRLTDQISISYVFCSGELSHIIIDTPDKEITILYDLDSPEFKTCELVVVFKYINTNIKEQVIDIFASGNMYFTGIMFPTRKLKNTGFIESLFKEANEIAEYDFDRSEIGQDETPQLPDLRNLKVLLASTYDEVIEKFNKNAFDLGASVA